MGAANVLETPTAEAAVRSDILRASFYSHVYSPYYYKPAAVETFGLYCIGLYY